MIGRRRIRAAGLACALAAGLVAGGAAGGSPGPPGPAGSAAAGAPAPMAGSPDRPEPSALHAAPAAPVREDAPEAISLGAAPEAPGAGADSTTPAAAPAAVEQVALERWMSTRGLPVAERVAAVRRAVRERGVPDLEPLARLLLLDTSLGSARERAAGAVALAPDLPAAHGALARSRLGQGDLLGAAGALADAARAVPGHLDSVLWLGATLGPALVWALALAGLGFVALVALRHAREASHDLGDMIERTMPGYARAALLGAWLLAPLVLGQGLLGVALALFVVAVAYGRHRARMALVAAAALTVVALHPGARWAGAWMVAPGADPVAEAAWHAERGYASPLDLVRLADAAEEGDPLALRALAAGLRRAGDLAGADALYAAALAQGGASPSLLHNAGAVRLALGDAEGAVKLLRPAAERSDTAVAWFNLAQAYGRAIRVEAHAAALERAQALDEDRVRELTDDLASSPELVLRDMALDAREVLPRLTDPDHARVAAAALRRPLAPGRLGASAGVTAVAFALCGLLGLFAGRHEVRSRRCRACAALLCPRCRPDREGGLECAACARIATRPGTMETSLREAHARRLARHATRRARADLGLALLVPGAASLGRGHGLRALAAWVLVCVAVAALAAPRLIAPDPLALGQLWPVGLAAALLCAGVAHLLAAAAAHARGGSARP